jgi:regulatory protein
MKRDNNNSNEKIKPSKPRTPPLPKKISERYLRNSGEFYLNRFPASTKHFLTVMTRKIDRSCRAHPDQNRIEWIEHVQDTLTPYFINLGFLNDELYSQALFNSLKNKNLSSFVIKKRMKEKGIHSDRISELYEQNMPDDSQTVLLFAKKKKIGKYTRTPDQYDEKQKQKDLGKLARAGFSYDQAIKAFEY